MLKYNTKFTPRLFTLLNDGVICYLNSLIQSLMGCSSFNEYLLTKYKGDNKIVNEYLKLFNSNVIRDNDGFKDLICDARPILRELISCRSIESKKNNLRFNQQEDIDEGLTFLLSSIDGIDKLFQINYKSEIVCTNCKHKSKPGNDNSYVEPHQLFIDVDYKNILEQKDIETKLELEKFIQKHVRIPHYYKCSNCGIQNGDKNVIVQVYTLTSLSEVLVLLYKKYYKKENRYFPNELNITIDDKQVKYKLISQTEHMGSMFGGHYTAKCLRVTPKFLEKYRLEKYKKILNKLNDSDAINKLNDDIKRDKILLQNETSVFNFNDTNVKYCPDGFEPSTNTYLLFYHLV